MNARGEVLAALAVTALATALFAPPVSAQDCSIGRDGWDDIQRFRRCLEEYNLDRWVGADSAVQLLTMGPGRTFNGSLNSSDAVWEDGSHYDVWTVTARAGQRVVIDMESEDVDLRVLRSDGTQIVTDDDGGSGSNARVEFPAIHAGNTSSLPRATRRGRQSDLSFRVWRMARNETVRRSLAHFREMK